MNQNIRRVRADLRRTSRANANVGAAICLLAAVSLSSVRPAAQGREWQVDRGDVRVLCPLTVGGSFEAKTTTVTGRIAPATAGAPRPGEFSVDLKTLDTGISLRNDHLRNSYLEVGKGDGFDRAVVSDVQLGTIDLDTFQGRTNFSGTLQLHGTRKMIAGQVQIRRDGTSVRVEATFPVTLADYGIAKPQYLGVGVKSEVQVRVDLIASPAAAGGTSR